MKRHSDKLSLRKSQIYEVNRHGDRDESILQKIYDKVQHVIAAFESSIKYYYVIVEVSLLSIIKEKKNMAGTQNPWLSQT